MTEPVNISVVIPVFNEHEIIPELLSRLGVVLDAIPGRHEIIFIDDGSTDRTLDLLRAAAHSDPRLTVLRLSRNFGHQAALTAGLDRARGDVIVLMDGDLQDPPEVIPRFLEHFRQGHDVVYAQRASRQEPWHRRLCYFLYYRLSRSLAEVPLPTDSGDFSLISKRVAEVIRSAEERSRYLRGLRAWSGFRQIGVPLDRDRRPKGTSKYGFLRLLKLALDGIFAFSNLPLKFATVLGGFTIALTFLFAVYSLYVKLVLHRSPHGFTALILAIVFTSGVQMVFLGVIGEYIGRIYNEVKRRPHYVIEERIGQTLE